MREAKRLPYRAPYCLIVGEGSPLPKPKIPKEKSHGGIT